MFRKFVAAFVMILFAASLHSTTFAKDGIDWERGIIRTTGFGEPPKNFDPKDSSAKTFARQTARMDALRQLVELIDGANVTSKGITLSQDSKAFKILEKNAQVVNVKFLDGGVCEVTMELPIFKGKGSLADMILSPFENEPKVSFPEPTTNVSLDNAKYTGLIVDCRGMRFNCVVLPTIKNSNGTPIYGYRNVADEKILENGLVGYVTDLNSAARTGNNPLIVKAIRLDNFATTPVISVADADKILAANQRDKFLDNCAVVFVR